MINSYPTLRWYSLLFIVTLSILTTGFTLFPVQRESHINGVAMASGKVIYTCPMDPQIRESKPGKCPICGMNLEETELTDTATTKPVKPSKVVTTDQVKPASSTMSGAVKYQCPMHPAIIREQPGDCPICGMKLVKMKSTSTSTSLSKAKGEKKIKFYRSPMDPKQTSPTPRKDEMGMDYVPVYEEEVTGGGGDVSNRTEVTIDPSRQQLIGLRTATVTRSDIRSDWHTVGRVQINQTKVSKTNVKVSGYVEKVFADFVGKPVKRGDPLFTFYSPEILAAQREYLLALRSLNSKIDPANDSLMVSIVKQKLLLWDVPQTDIDRLEQTGEISKTITIIAPSTGVVSMKNIVEGSAMNPGDAAFEITDLNSVWVMADAYQADVARAKIGMPASISLQSFPNRVFNGTVTFIDPVLDPQSRTFKIRIQVENSSGELKPEMFAEVTLQTSSHNALTIPTDAIIPSGRATMVFVALGEGRFQPRAVKTGEKSGDRIEITEGVMEGENVVTRANFLVDSESSLRAALAAVGGN